MAKLATSAVVLPVLARYLGIEGYGQYAYYLAVLLLASQFANVGMMQTMTRRIAERPEDRAWCRSVARSGALINGAGVLGAGLAAGLLIWRTASHDTAAVPIALAVVGVLLFDQVWFYARGVLHGFRHEERVAVPGIIGVLMAGSFGVLAAVTGMGVAFASVSGGVAGVSCIFQSGWKAVKCSGTSGPSSRATQAVNARSSASESLSPGISSVVISSQQSLSWWIQASVSSTGCRCAPH